MAALSPAGGWSAKQVAKSVSKIDRPSARRHTMPHAPSKARYQKSASETEARDGDNEAQSETRRLGDIRRMSAFRADFPESPADNGGDRPGWLRMQSPSNLSPAIKFPSIREKIGNSANP